MSRPRAMGRLMKFMVATVLLMAAAMSSALVWVQVPEREGCWAARERAANTGTTNSRAMRMVPPLGLVVPTIALDQENWPRTGPILLGGSTSRYLSDGRHHHRLDGVHAVFGLVEDNAVPGAEDLVGDFADVVAQGLLVLGELGL